MDRSWVNRRATGWNSEDTMAIPLVPFVPLGMVHSKHSPGAVVVSAVIEVIVEVSVVDVLGRRRHLVKSSLLFGNGMLTVILLLFMHEGYATLSPQLTIQS